MKQNMVFLAGVVCFLLTACNNIFYTLASSGNEPDTGEYIVRFDKNGGDTEAYPQTVIVKAPGSTVMLPSIEPVREGYLFTAWNTNADGSGVEFTKDTLVKANITVYAQWLFLPTGSFIVHFDKNNTDANSQEAYPQNKAVIPPSDTISGALPAEPIRTGYDFTGWNTERDGTGTVFDENTTVTESITVYAQWEPYKCIITFDKNHNDDGGFKEADPQTITVTYPATSTGVLPAPPERDHYNFTGWNTKADGTGEEFTAGTPVEIIENKTLTVYAQWAEKTYTISGTIYRSGGEGASGAMVSLFRDSNLVDTAWADANGAYVFSGILARNNYTIQASLERHLPDTTPPFNVDWKDTTAPDLNLIRLWVISGTVKEESALETNGNPVANALLVVTQPGRPDQSVYTDSTGSYELDVYSGECHITVTKVSYVDKEESIDVSSDREMHFNLVLITYAVSGTVTLDGGSGNVQDVNLQLTGNGINKTATPQTNGSYNFPAVRMGDYAYTISATLSGYKDDQKSFNITNADVPNINLILRKLWTVTFQSDGGNPIPGPQTVAHNDAVTRPQNPTRLGYTFDNWYSDSERNTVYNFATPVTSDITLYAKWEVVPTYTVSFNANGATSGTAPSAQMVNAETIITLPGAGTLSRTGYTFGGWNTNAAGNGTNYNAGSSYTVNDNVTLYAKWNEIPQYTVTFNINGGSGTTPASQTRYAGVDITLPDDSGFSRDGYTFGGWNTNTTGTGTNYNAGASYTISGNITLYAKWNAIPQYTITFSINGGSGTTPASQTVNAGTVITLPDQGDLSRTGYSFGGWNTASNGNGTNYDAGSSYTVEGTRTLYAKWNPIQYTVSFDANGGSGTMANQSFTYGVSQNLRSNTFTNEGYTFAGWAISAGGPVEYTNGQSVNNLTTTHGATVTLYAQWDVIPQYTITFDRNDATSGTVPASQTVNAGTVISLPGQGDLSRTGYTFGGWNTSATGTGTNYDAGASYTVNGTRTLYAKWTETGTNPSNPPSGIVILSDGNTNYQDVLVQIYTVDWISQDLVPHGSPIKPDENGDFSIPNVTEIVYFIAATLDGYITVVEPIYPSTQFPVILILHPDPEASEASQSISLQQLLLQLNN
jgi:uncharacterized repeat protein (TIGR02543 family)